MDGEPIRQGVDTEKDLCSKNFSDGNDLLEFTVYHERYLIPWCTIMVQVNLSTRSTVSTKHIKGTLDKNALVGCLQI